MILPKYQKRFENLNYNQREQLFKNNRELHDALKEDYLRRKKEGLLNKGTLYTTIEGDRNNG